MNYCIIFQLVERPFGLNLSDIFTAEDQFAPALAVLLPAARQQMNFSGIRSASTLGGLSSYLSLSSG